MMPKKKTAETQSAQSARFRAEVERRIAAGELSPTDADRLFDKALGGVARLRQEWFDGQEDPENPS